MVAGLVAAGVGSGPASAAGAQSLRQTLGSQGIFQIDRTTGTPRQVARLDGFLTGPSKAAPEKIARSYLAAHRQEFGLDAADLAGLTLRKDYVDIAGTHHLSFTQNVGGVEVFGSGVKAHITKAGRLISIDGAPQPGLPTSVGTATIDAPAARKAAVRGVKRASSVAVRSATATSATFADGGRVRQVVFSTASGPTLAWEVIALDVSELTVVDAADGKILFRKSLSANHHGLSWENYPGAPSGGTQHLTNLDSWLPMNASKLSGNVAHVYSDVNGDDAAQASEEVTPAGKRSFDFPFTDFSTQVGAPCSLQRQCSWDPAVPYSWQTNRAQNAVQLFSFIGTWHDHLAAEPIGFTRAAGNFEAIDGDAVNGESMDGADTANGLPDDDHTFNANMDTPPDGLPGHMQMYLFPKSTRFLVGNSGDAADVVFHEYTHGLSNRLIVDAGGNSTLISPQAMAMGEAWGDWYGLDYLVDRHYEQDDAVDGDVREGDYLALGQTIRREPMDCPVASTAPACAGTATSGTGGYTYGDYGKVSAGPEVHADGEIWAQTLWDLRGAIGSRKAQSLVTRAMELAPADPSFLDMRNAILIANRVVDNARGQDTIWRVFAARGMGVNASTQNAADTSPIEDFTVPQQS